MDTLRSTLSTTHRNTSWLSYSADKFNDFLSHAKLSCRNVRKYLLYKVEDISDTAGGSNFGLFSFPKLKTPFQR